MSDLTDRRRKLNPKFKHEAYKNYSHMLYRCHNERSARYKEWGGRGIVVCDEWRNDFWQFVKDMGPKPTPKHSIDRIDNNGNYEPSNCRWATPRQQTLNSSQAVMWTFEGKTQCIKDWALELKVPYKLLTKRKCLGWTVEEALTIDSNHLKRTNRKKGFLKNADQLKS